MSMISRHLRKSSDLVRISSQWKSIVQTSEELSDYQAVSIKDNTSQECADSIESAAITNSQLLGANRLLRVINKSQRQMMKYVFGQLRIVHRRHSYNSRQLNTVAENIIIPFIQVDILRKQSLWKQNPYPSLRYSNRQSYYSQNTSGTKMTKSQAYSEESQSRNSQELLKQGYPRCRVPLAIIKADDNQAIGYKLATRVIVRISTLFIKRSVWECIKRNKLRKEQKQHPSLKQVEKRMLRHIAKIVNSEKEQVGESVTNIQTQIQQKYRKNRLKIAPKDRNLVQSVVQITQCIQIKFLKYKLWAFKNLTKCKHLQKLSTLPQQYLHNSVALQHFSTQDTPLQRNKWKPQICSVALQQLLPNLII